MSDYTPCKNCAFHNPKAKSRKHSRQMSMEQPLQPNSASSNHKHTYLHNVNDSGGRVVSQVVTTGYVVGDYHTHRLTKQGTDILYEILHNGTVIFSKSNTCANAIATETVPCLCIGRWETGAKFKNIKVEAL